MSLNVNALKPGDVINEGHNIRFLVASLYQGVTKHQKPYVACTLQNKEQKLDWFVWDMTKEDFPVKEGQIIWIQTARIDERNGSLQVADMVYTTVQDNSANYLPSISDERRELLVREMEQICRDNIPQASPLFNVVNHILFQSQLGEQFRWAPAAIRIHAAMLGGLLEHSIAVTKTALQIAEGQQVDKALLTAGSILHDIGKTAMYTYNPVIDITPAGALLEHIVLGVMLVNNITRQLRNADAEWSKTFPKEYEFKLLHLIVSHQSKPEWGSPVQPAIPEALILATADGAVSRLETYNEEIQKVDSGKSSWSQLMKQFIYKPKEFEHLGVKW